MEKKKKQKSEENGKDKGWLVSKLAGLFGKTHTLHTAVPINLFYDFTSRAQPTKDKRPNAKPRKIRM